MADAKKIDPFDVEALEKSLNDSATRVSTIWVSFLIFALYLLTAAATVTHRQLLLAEAVKLPVLNIDLPLWGFFFLAPILFVIFHAYVLLQVLLLGRTAAAYNEALDKAVKPPPSNAAMRQRLANTLFAQIFAGSPRERKGWLGWLLKAMAWITLAVAPILIIVAFQIGFLPYHSHLATWTHRILIFLELATAFLLWPLVLDAQRDLSWLELKFGIKRLVTLPKRVTVFLFWPLVRKRPWRFEPSAWSPNWSQYQQQREFHRLYRQSFAAAVSLLFVFLSLWFATFPGEPHVNILSGRSLKLVTCERWFGRQLDRLDVTRVGFVDGKELPRIEKDIVDRALKTYDGERTRNLRGRDLSCATFAYADLRYAEFSDAKMIGATFDGASLQGATFDNSRLAGASFNDSKLQGSSLRGAQLQQASLKSASLQGAYLTNAKLQGALLDAAQLQGASLDNAALQGTSLVRAQLQGAYLFRAQLQGASLSAQLQGAYLSFAQLQGASLNGALLQGADFRNSSTTASLLSRVFVWRAQSAQCEGHVNAPRHEKNLSGFPYLLLGLSLPPVTADVIEEFVDNAVSDIRDASTRQRTHERMKQALASKLSDDDLNKIEAGWNDCAEKSKVDSATIHERRAQLLIKSICEGREYGSSIAKGLIRNWLVPGDGAFVTLFSQARSQFDREFAAYFAGLLATEVDTGCSVATSLQSHLKQQIKDVAAGKVSPTRPPPNDFISSFYDF